MREALAWYAAQHGQVKWWQDAMGVWLTAAGLGVLLGAVVGWVRR